MFILLILSELINLTVLKTKICQNLCFVIYLFNYLKSLKFLEYYSYLVMYEVQYMHCMEKVSIKLIMNKKSKKTANYLLQINWELRKICQWIFFILLALVQEYLYGLKIRNLFTQSLPNLPVDFLLFIFWYLMFIRCQCEIY